MTGRRLARFGPTSRRAAVRCALLGVFALPACSTYRAYAGAERPKKEVATLFCDLSGVTVRTIDSYQMSGGWSDFELLPGPHRVVAELYWTRLERVVEGPEKQASFVARAGTTYRCVFDVDEKKPDWALAIVPDDKVSWEARTFHGARSWRTPEGNCVVWDASIKGCLGDADANDAAADTAGGTQTGGADEKSGAAKGDAIAP